MHPPMIHGRDSSTFVSPPLGSAMTLPEMYDWHEKNSYQHPLFTFGDESAHATIITWGEAVLAMRRATKFVTSKVAPFEKDKDNGRIVIGILASLGPSLLYQT